MSGTADGTGIMFLNEAALGKEHHITTCNFRLTAPPKGFDSIIAKGRNEPSMYRMNVLKYRYSIQGLEMHCALCIDTVQSLLNIREHPCYGTNIYLIGRQLPGKLKDSDEGAKLQQISISNL